MNRRTSSESSLAHPVRHRHAVFDGEIVCLDEAGVPQFNRLPFQRARAWPVFYAFDVLSVDGRDLRPLPLQARKRDLRRIVPKRDSRPLYVEPFAGTGRALYREVCRRDLEGIVAKHRRAPYSQDPTRTTWLTVKNMAYSQARDRHELFAGRAPRRRRHQPLTVGV
jgi:bifunctional non-homologous end joining protein LigD